MNHLTNWRAKTPRSALVARFFCLVFTLTALALPTCAEAQFTTKPAVLVSKVGGKCLKVLNGSTADGATVVQWTCDDSTGSRWKLATQAGGTSPYVRVIASHSGKCLSVAGGSTADHTPVVQNACTGIDSQLWTVQSIGQFYRLVAKHSGKCLNVDGNDPNSGANLIQWPCAGNDNEIWSFSEGFLGPSQRSRIVNSSTDQCIDVSGASTGENAAVIQWPCKTTTVANEQWALQRSSDGYQLNALHSNKCLAAWRGSTAENGIMAQVTCGTADSQIWSVNINGSNYILINKSSKKCLDLGGNQVSAGVSLVQRTCNNAATQKWRVTSAGDVGSWSTRVSLPILPVSAATLYNNNKVLFWASEDGFTFGGPHGWTQTALRNK